jgi:7,8-dihydropterin-6-yl-methyl-4-(beta-D-ribofuranosyl)aminobenzene 5'-phosphate synthase
MKRLLIAVAVLFLLPHVALAAQVQALKVTVLSTMLAEPGIGEWGYAALVEVDGRKILFDTGARPETVLTNARELGVDLSDIEDVVLSHNHFDHTGGLLALRKAVMGKNPKALSRVHVADGFFLPAQGGPRMLLLGQRAALEAAGVTFIVHKGPAELAPGVWVTGPVPRKTEEKNFPASLKVQTAAGATQDTVPDDQALVFDTAEGAVVLTGCGHSGAINLVEHARAITNAKTVAAVIGGLHIFDASDARLDWTGAELKAAGVKYLLMGHCTGLEATWRLRQAIGLTRKTAAYGANGSTFILGKGINPGRIAG